MWFSTWWWAQKHAKRENFDQNGNLISTTCPSRLFIGEFIMMPALCVKYFFGDVRFLFLLFIFKNKIKSLRASWCKGLKRLRLIFIIMYCIRLKWVEKLAEVLVYISATRKNQIKFIAVKSYKKKRITPYKKTVFYHILMNSRYFLCDFNWQ